MPSKLNKLPVLYKEPDSQTIGDYGMQTQVPYIRQSHRRRRIQSSKIWFSLSIPSLWSGCWTKRRPGL